MKLAFVDTETTGLDPLKHRVIEAAVQVVDVTHAGLEVLSSLEFRQRVDLKKHAWEQGALHVNGYREDHPDWAYAPESDTDNARIRWEMVQEMTRGLPLCSQNVPFDRDFMAAEMRRFNLEPAWDRRFVEITSFSFLIALANKLPKFGLHDAYKALDARDRIEHRAMADVERGKAVFEKVLQSFFAREG